MVWLAESSKRKRTVFVSGENTESRMLELLKLIEDKGLSKLSLNICP